MAQAVADEEKNLKKEEANEEEKDITFAELKEDAYVLNARFLNIGGLERVKWDENSTISFEREGYAPMVFDRRLGRDIYRVGGIFEGRGGSAAIDLGWDDSINGLFKHRHERGPLGGSVNVPTELVHSSIGGHCVSVKLGHSGWNMESCLNDLRLFSIVPCVADKGTRLPDDLIFITDRASHATLTYSGPMARNSVEASIEQDFYKLKQQNGGGVWKPLGYIFMVAKQKGIKVCMDDDMFDEIEKYLSKDNNGSDKAKTKAKALNGKNGNGNGNEINKCEKLFEFLYENVMSRKDGKDVEIGYSMADFESYFERADFGFNMAMVTSSFSNHRLNDSEKVKKQQYYEIVEICDEMLKGLGFVAQKCEMAQNGDNQANTTYSSLTAQDSRVLYGAIYDLNYLTESCQISGQADGIASRGIGLIGDCFALADELFEDKLISEASHDVVEKYYEIVCLGWAGDGAACGFFDYLDKDDNMEAFKEYFQIQKQGKIQPN